MSKIKLDVFLSKRDFIEIGKIICESIPCYECPIKDICENSDTNYYPFEELSKSLLSED